MAQSPRDFVSRFYPHGLGWIPDLPDPRDYSSVHEEILPQLQRLQGNLNRFQLAGLTDHESMAIPDQIDLRHGDEGEVYLPEVEDQRGVSSSTVFTVLSMVEYFERRIHARTLNPSRLFLYKVARNLRNRTHKVADGGADFRTTLKALRQFGVPPEDLWPYDPSRVNQEPTGFVYHSAQRMDSLRYFHVEPSEDSSSKDSPASKRSNQKGRQRTTKKQKLSKTTQSNNRSKNAQWDLLVSFVAAGFPVAFGFSVPSSITDSPNIPFRPDYDSYIGGTTALAIGYDLNHFGRNQPGLLIRTSWGSKWGDNGYGWLPAGFVRNYLARDFWCLMSEDWLDATELSRPSIVEAPTS